CLVYPSWLALLICDFSVTIVSSQYRLFKDYPETKAYFKTIPTEGNLQEDPLVRFHGRRVMVALNQVVENLDNWKQACRILDRLADKHKNVHQVPAVNFQVLMHSIQWMPPLLFLAAPHLPSPISNLHGESQEL
uniref:superoxide dismutase n=1 Tax=Gopherus evgoodei TaxID=1825980 RepID=A0A8C4W5Z5_9SAUR